MKRKLLFFAVLLSVLIASCGGGEPSAASTSTSLPATSTPDLCSSALLPSEVKKVHDHMRAFDDYSSLASRTQQSQLLQLIPDMQRIQREAEDQVVPPCLVELKKLQLYHMNLVVETLIAFMNNVSAESLNKAITQSREYHKQYDIEIARLLGVTIVSPSQVPGAAATAAPNGTPGAAIVTNPGPAAVNLRIAPEFDANAVGVLEVQASMNALGKSADGQWVKVENPAQPGQVAWVYTPLIQLSVPIEQLQVVQ